MARDGIWVAQQPNFTYTLEGRYLANLEGDRLAHNNPLRSVVDAGIPLALGSDILPIGPMIGLYAATTRRGLSGAVYAPTERLSIEEAIAGYTRGGAGLTREGADKGSLELGKLADLIVLEADPRRVSPDALRRLRVDLTVLGGRVVYRRTTPVRRTTAPRGN
jgi:predicted amidohydrolase YtcJ